MTTKKSKSTPTSPAPKKRGRPPKNKQPVEQKDNVQSMTFEEFIKSLTPQSEVPAYDATQTVTLKVTNNKDDVDVEIDSTGDLAYGQDIGLLVLGLVYKMNQMTS